MTSFLLFVWWLDIVVVPAGAGGRQLEGLNSEWQVLVIRVVDEEPVVDRLLQAFGFVAVWDQRTGGPFCGALLNPCSLREGLVVGLHIVDNDPPLATDVDGPLGLDVAGLRRAQIGFVIQLLQSVNRVLCVGHYFFVQLPDIFLVVLQGLLDLVFGVLFILNTPVLPILTLGTQRG